MVSAFEKLEVLEPLQAISLTVLEPLGKARKIRLTPFLIATLTSSIIPISALAIGLYFKRQCPIDQNIPQFMIVSGLCSLVLIVLVLLFALILVYSDASDRRTSKLIAKCCSIDCWILGTTGGLIFFMIIWLCFGCGSIFAVRQRVQFSDRTNAATYCHPVLYHGSFGFAIVSLVLTFIFCGALRYC